MSNLGFKKDLFDSEELAYIEFSEYSGNNYTLSQDGGDGSDVDIDYLFTDDRHRRHHESYDQDGGAFTDDGEEPASIDYLFQTETKDRSHQMGGVSSTERDFMAMFNASNAYAKRINKLADDKKTTTLTSESSDDQTGGKRKLNPTIAGMLEITSHLRQQEDHIKRVLRDRIKMEEEKRGEPYRNMQGIFMKVSKIIWDHAERQVGSGANPDAILKKALELVKNLDKYLDEYKDTKFEPKPKKEKKKKAKKE